MRASLATALILLAATANASEPTASSGPTLAGVLEASQAADWRRPDPENLLQLELPGGSVLIELAPDFAPRHVANIRTLVRQGYFDGLGVVRSQDNYVAQWGDPAADQPEQARSLGEAAARLAAEFERSIEGAPAFTPLPDGDVYAPEVGFSLGFPAARDAARGMTWLAHCYGMVGVSRDNDPDSGSGAGLYAVTGHAPRHLDRNITLVGRVLRGMEHLSALPRGSGPLGFYQGEERGPVIARVRLAADLAEPERPAVEVFRTDTAAFAQLVEARRFRREAWFHHPTGRVELCNVPLPVREARPH